MSYSFELLRNQINDAYIYIRPMTSDFVIRAISAMELENDEENVAGLSIVISRLRDGISSDYFIIQNYVSSSTGPSVPILQELLTEADRPVEERPRLEEQAEEPQERFEEQAEEQEEPVTDNNIISNDGRMISDFFAMF